MIGEIILRFLITFVLASIFGIERQYSHKPVGFGTYIFVATGSCALAVIAQSFGNGNPISLIGAIVTGIGFLGAGALIKTTDKIFGFTSAASIWIFAIFGLSIGLGSYLIGIMLYVLIWVVIMFDRHLELRGVGSYQRRLTIKANRMVTNKEIDSILAFNKVKKFKMMNIEVDKKEKTVSMTYLVEGTKDHINHLAKKLYEHDWFESMKCE